MPTEDVINDLLALDDDELVEVLVGFDDAERIALLQAMDEHIENPYLKYGGDLEKIITQEWGEVIWSKQRDILKSFRENQRTCVVTTPGIGKDLPLDTPLPTPGGWTTMGDVSVGDYVLGNDGKPARVSATTPVQFNELFRITFNDGTSQVAGADHQWATLDADTRRRVERRMRVAGRRLDWREHWDQTVVRTTRELRESLWSTTQNRLNHLIPVSSPIDLPEVELPIDPYVFGAWLGDGDSRRPYMTIGDDGLEILKGFERAGTPLQKIKGDIRFSFPGVVRGDTMRALRSLGVLKNKHIPDMYLRASVDQRASLLRGIMDTDGFIVGNGAGIDLMSETLALDVAELVRSLGMKTNVRINRATISGRDVGVRYRMSFSGGMNPFGYISYKHDNWQPNQPSAVSTGRVVVSVEPVPTVPTRCIKVENEQHLYLAGYNFIPTHNSDIVSMIVCALIADVMSEPTQIRIVTTAANFRLVKTIMWPYIKRVAADHLLPGSNKRVGPDRMNMTEWFVKDTLVADGVSSEDKDETSMRGIHSLGRVVVIVDEASGISHTIGRVLNGLLTTEDDRLVVLGNPPTEDTDTWFEWFSEQKIVNTITIPFTETPNFTGEKTGICTRCSPRIPQHTISKHLTSAKTISDVRAQYPDDNDPYVRAFLYAEFPTGNVAKTIPMAFIQKALPITTRDNKPFVDEEWIEKSKRTGPIRLGVDVASDGGDELVVAQRDGWHGTILHTSSGPTNENALVVAGKVKTYIEDACKKHQERGMSTPVMVNVDRNGVGWGVTSFLQEWVVEQGLNAVVVGVMSGEKARQEQRFLKQRSEMWWNMRELLQGDDVEITFGIDEMTVKQLNGPTYTTDTAGRTQVEPKSKMAARGVKSPDRADALILAYYESPSKRRNLPPKDIPVLSKVNEANPNGWFS